ncbi:MAG: hypothetical protein ACI3XP_00540 [Eubacteriales bacterium]
MKKLLYIVLFMLLMMTSRGKNEVLNDCVISSERAVWGERIYSIQPILDKGVFLTYTEVDDEDETVYIACLDPLCAHTKDECVAYSNAPSTTVALVPKEKGMTIYYFRCYTELKDPTNPSEGIKSFSDLLALDIQTGRCSVVTTIPFAVWGNMQFMLTDDYAYFTLNSMEMQIESDTQSINIWRAPLTGGELQQCTFSEDIMAGCYVEHYENGILYYRRGDTLCRTVDDFATEEIVMENLNFMWKVVFHDDWIYYTEDRKTIIYKPDEPQAEGYSNVYRYSNERYTSALDSANSCTLVRIKNDGSGTKETLITGVSPCFNNTTPTWCVVDNILYCVPVSFELQGTIEWNSPESPNSLTYIWSHTGGELLALDLDTLNISTVLVDLGYDIESIQYVGNNRLLVKGKCYDVDAIRRYYENHEILMSDLQMDVWKIFDIKNFR